MIECQVTDFNDYGVNLELVDILYCKRRSTVPSSSTGSEYEFKVWVAGSRVCVEGIVLVLDPAPFRVDFFPLNFDSSSSLLAFRFLVFLWRFGSYGTKDKEDLFWQRLEEIEFAKCILKFNKIVL